MKKLLLFIVFLSYFFGGNTVAQTGWFWQNPYITGNTLNAMSFIDESTGWIIGHCAQILKTTDAGNTFVSYSVPVNIYYLRSIWFVNNQTGWCAGDDGTIMKSTNGGINWFSQTSGTMGDFYWIRFISLSTGWAGGTSGIIFKTTNSGDTWFSQASSGNNLYCGCFLNSNTGYVCGASGAFKKTTDGGSTWNNVPIGSTAALWNMYFVSPETGWVTTDSIRKTTNGGQNWFAQPVSGYISNLSSPIDMWFKNSTTGYMLEQNNGYFSKTTNAGANWVRRNYIGINYFQRVKFFNDNTGFVCGQSGVLYKTTDGGNDWTKISPYYFDNPILYSIHFVNSLTGYTCGDANTVYKTTDGGTNWTACPAPGGNSYFQDVAFVNMNTGVAVGAAMRISLTTNAGITWTNLSYGGINPIYKAVSFPTETIGYIFGTQGAILKSTNSGLNWTSLPSFTTSSLWSGTFITDSIGWAVSNLIHKTTNGGMNWFTQTSPVSTQHRDVKFANSQTGWIVCDGGTIIKTTNGGTNWFTQVSGFTYPLYGISVAGTEKAWAVGPYGTVLYTSNGGANWIKQVSTTNQTLYHVQFITENMGWVAGDIGTILKTVNGGLTTPVPINITNNGLNKPILDNQSTYDTIIISNDVFAGFTADVNLKLDTIIHTNDGDLEISIIHQGINDTAVYQVGGSGDNFIGTILDDEATVSISNGTAPFTGSYKPSKPLSQLKNTAPGGYWILRIYDRAVGNTGTLKAWGLNITTSNSPVGIKNISSEIPSGYKLEQNYPNPFNQSSIIKFQCPLNGMVELKIFDLLGREVAVLVNEYLQPGTYQVNFNAEYLSSGIYFYRLKIDGFSETKKFILLK